MTPYELNEIGRRVSGECGLSKVWVLGDEVLGGGINVCEITPAAPGDQDLPADLGIMLQQRNAKAAFSRVRGAEKPGSTAADDDRVGPFIRQDIFRSGYSDGVERDR